MAREKMVTRTIDFIYVTVLALDTETRESREVLIQMSVVDDTDKMLKEAKKQAHRFNAHEIPVLVLRYETKSVKYGMSENDFMTYGKILD